VGVVIMIRRHYEATTRLLHRLDNLVQAAKSLGFELLPGGEKSTEKKAEFDPKEKTAVLLVNGFNGVGLHTLLNVFRLYGEVFKNFVFGEIGVVDAGLFKGLGAIDRLQVQVMEDLDSYVNFVKRKGYYGEGVTTIGVDVAEEVTKIAPQIIERFPQAIFIGGQLVFPEDTFLSRLLHNYTLFAIQRKLYHQGIPFVVLPIRVY
jgi:hypothetical protein